MCLLKVIVSKIALHKLYQIKQSIWIFKKCLCILKGPPSFLRGTKFSNRGWRHRQSWFFAKCFSFREHFNDGETRKLSESFCACFFVLDLKYVITNVSRKVFFQHDMRAGTSTDLFQNNKICTTSRSKICSGDVHVLDLFPIFTPLLKYCAS